MPGAMMAIARMNRAACSSTAAPICQVAFTGDPKERKLDVV